MVSIAELIRAIRIPLGEDTVDSCANADVDGDGMIAINELILAVNNALTGCGDELPAPDLITFEHDSNLEPEGIEYDAERGRFLVGSRTDGLIYAVADDGTLTELVSDSGLSVSLGLDVDDVRGRVLAAGALSGAGTPALGIYALAGGARIHVVDLGPVAAPGQHLANDVVSDGAGNAYVTDTLAHAIYRVDVAGQATAFAAGADLTTANGIEIYDDRYLIVAKLTGPSLVRIPLDDPQTVTAVSTAMPIAGDGIVFAPDGDLAVVMPNGVVVRLRSGDDWQSATVVGTWDATELAFGTPTTAATRGADVYVVFAHLFDQARRQYEIARALFPAPPGQ
jgi:sugar lactone lactonase YvrE